MAPKPTRPATLHVAAHERLHELRTQLGRQRLPRDVQLVDILSALVLYSTPPQVAGMLLEYWAYIDARLEAEADGEPPPPLPRWG
jgi:hypothetical protein